MQLTALTRQVSPGMNRCELTHIAREPIDIEQARLQHEEYEQILTELGCRVVRLPAEPELPDSVFVEDTAVVLDELAIITRPGTPSRRAETGSVAGALKDYRKLMYIQAPGSLDGGDVLIMDKTLYVGQSSRSNQEGIEQLRRAVEPYGYRVQEVALSGCLHLKTAVTRPAEHLLVLNPDWVDAAPFRGMRVVFVDPAEPFGANVLAVAGTVIQAAAYPKTTRRLESEGLTVVTADLSELAKAEGAVTCCSLIFQAR